MAGLRFPLTGVVALAVAVLVPTGARAELVAVQGKVTLDDRPLAQGKVIFHLDNGKSFEIPIKDGVYSSDRVPIGQMPITVEGKGVPAKYTQARTTPLRAVIKKPRNQINIALVK